MLASSYYITHLKKTGGRGQYSIYGLPYTLVLYSVQLRTLSSLANCYHWHYTSYNLHLSDFLDYTLLILQQCLPSDCCA